MVWGGQVGLPSGPPPQLWPKLVQYLCEHLLCSILGGYFLGTCSERKFVLGEQETIACALTYASFFLHQLQNPITTLLGWSHQPRPHSIYVPQMAEWSTRQDGLSEG